MKGKIATSLIFLFSLFLILSLLSIEEENQEHTSRDTAQSPILETEQVQNNVNWPDNIAKLVIAIIGASVGALVTNGIQQRARRRSYAPMILKGDRRKNTVVMLGLGQTGKSTLISTLSQTNCEPPEQTNVFSITEFEITESDKLSTTVYMTDYRGQDFKQMVSKFVEEQLKPNTVVRYKDINSLILVVDLFSFDPTEDVLSKEKDLDIERINNQISEWNDTALNAVFGLLGGALKYVCLFINKIDKWENGNAADANSDIESSFGKLISEIKDKCGNTIDFEVIIGSAILGTSVIGINSINDRLVKYSVPPKND